MGPPYSGSKSNCCNHYVLTGLIKGCLLISPFEDEGLIKLFCCIGEVLDLVNAFKSVSEEYFPHAELSERIVCEYDDTPERISMVKSAK